MHKQTLKDRFSALDHYLLINHRVLWEMKAHYLGIYLLSIYSIAFLFVLVATTLTPSYFLSTYNIPLINFSHVINSIVLLFWLYKCSRNSVEGGFGYKGRFIDQTRFLIYFVGTSLLFASPTVINYFIHYRTATHISDQELVDDIQTLNEGNIFFPDIRYLENNKVTDNIFYSLETGFEEHYDCKYFGAPVLEFLKNENYQLTSPTTANNHCHHDNRTLFRATKSEGENLLKIKKFLVAFEKYSGHTSPHTAQEIYRNFHNEEYHNTDLPKQEVKTLINKLKKSKIDFATTDRYSNAIVKLLYRIFFLSIVYQIFRHVGIWQFLLGIILLSGMAGIIGFCAIITNDTVAIIFTGFIGILFLIIVSTINKLKEFAYFSSLCLISLQVMSSMLLPILVLTFVSRQFPGLLLAANISNMVLYVFFALPQFRKLHLQLRALPKE